MKKRLLSIFLSALIVISFEIPFVSASSTLTQFDFDSETLELDAKEATFTTEDGSTAEFILGAEGTQVTVENEDELLPGNADSNRFLKFDYNGDAGNEIASRLRITPASPLKKDFVLEFDYALNCETGTHADYSPYEGFVDITFFPGMQVNSGDMWKYGSRVVTIDQTYRVKTPKTNMINPEFWSGYNNYATGYTGNSGFATMKIVTRFIEDDYPVYDVYVKLPDADNFTKLVTDKQYADTGYGNIQITPADYNNDGFQYIHLDLLTGRQEASRTSDRVLDAAIDNIKIYEYTQDFYMNFDDKTLGSDVKTSAFSADDGTIVEFTSGATGASVTIQNGDDIVPENPSSNKFVKYDYFGDAGSDTASRMKITPAIPLKSDFSFEFDFALNRVGDTDGYDAYDRFVDITFFPNMQGDTGNLWKYGTKAVSIGQDFKVKVPTSPASAITPNFWTGYKKYGEPYEPNSGFATMKVITRFIEGDYPVYDVYVKYPGDSDFTEIVTGRQYATVGYGAASLAASDYNDYGFGCIYVEFLTGQEAKSRIPDNEFDAAIDNLRIEKLGTIEIDSLYSDGMVIPNDCGFQITGSGLEAGSDVRATIYTESGTPMIETTGVGDENGDFALEFEEVSALSFGEYYYIEVRSGDLSKRISNVLCGNVIAFDGAEGYADASENYTRAFIDGTWYAPGEYNGHDYERTIAGNLSGMIIGADNIATLPANYVVYTVSNQNLDEKALESYVKPLISQGKKVIFTGVLKSTSLSDEEVFELENRLNNLSKKYYGDVLFVPVLGGNDDPQRVAAVLSGEKSQFDYWDINVDGNQVYLPLSDTPKSVDKNSFMCEDIDGNTYVADSANINGKTIKLTFENAGAIIKVMHGKTGEGVIRSSADDMPLPRFAAEFSASEKYDFAKRYDREKFVSLFSFDNSNLNTDDEKLTITKKAAGDFGVERKNLYYTTDHLEIKLDASGSKDVKLFADNQVFFEGSIEGEETILLKREDDQLYVNGEKATDDISVIRNLKIEFCNCSEVQLNKFEISMPSYSKVVTLILNIDKLPSAENATYTDKALIQSVYEEYVSLGGDGNSYLTSEQKAKMKALEELLEVYQSAEKEIKDQVVVEADIPKEYKGKEANQTITLTNNNDDVSYALVCVAAVYSSDGKLVNLASQNVTLNEKEQKHEVNLSFDVDGASRVDLYVLKDIWGGYVIYQSVDIPVK